LPYSGSMTVPIGGNFTCLGGGVSWEWGVTTAPGNDWVYCGGSCGGVVVSGTGDCCGCTVDMTIDMSGPCGAGISFTIVGSITVSSGNCCSLPRTHLCSTLCGGTACDGSCVLPP
jgi:hypothetical protein